MVIKKQRFERRTNPHEDPKVWFILGTVIKKHLSHGCAKALNPRSFWYHFGIQNRHQINEKSTKADPGAPGMDFDTFWVRYTMQLKIFQKLLNLRDAKRPQKHNF